MARLKNQFEFISGMYFDGEMFFNKYVMTINFSTLSDSPQDQNTALDRMAYFMYDTVARSVFIHEDDFDSINLLTKAGLLVLTVPDPGPFDPMILSTTVTKMNAITEGVLTITEAEIISEVSGPLIYVWDINDEEDDIHEIVNDTDINKWWASPAPRFGSYPDGVDVAVVEEKSPFPLTWATLKLGWENDETVEVELTTVTKKGSTVIKADFNSVPKKK